jgi:hypothetical protein
MEATKAVRLEGGWGPWSKGPPPKDLLKALLAKDGLATDRYIAKWCVYPAGTGCVKCCTDEPGQSSIYIRDPATTYSNDAINTCTSEFI